NGRRLRLRYGTQIKSRPPTYAFFVTRPAELPDSYARYLATSLREVFDNRHGVCQDFAHVMIAGLRGLGLPAAYVSGYLRT
ncbi:transglutaminase domain-containing protein, partial [Acinetobacter baumannii]